MFILSFIQKKIPLVSSTYKGFVVDTVEDTNESDMCPILKKFIF